MKRSERRWPEGGRHGDCNAKCPLLTQSGHNSPFKQASLSWYDPLFPTLGR
jgi:hypothetical protein